MTQRTRDLQPLDTPEGAAGTTELEQLTTLRTHIRASVHDLRNLLASQASAVRMLTRSAGDGDRAAVIHTGLAEQCDRMLEIVNRLSAVARTLGGAGSLQAAVDRSKASVPTGSPRRILIVDDNVDAAVSLATMLRIEGHEVLTAHDGQQAVQVVRTSQPEIVVLDIEMPIMDGYAAARQIRQLRSEADCKLIAVSGHCEAEDHERSLAAGFYAHLAKPVDPEALMRLF